LRIDSEHVLRTNEQTCLAAGVKGLKLHSRIDDSPPGNGAATHPLSINDELSGSTSDIQNTDTFARHREA